jgi:hypothetical protein
VSVGEEDFAKAVGEENFVLVIIIAQEFNYVSMRRGRTQTLVIDWFDMVENKSTIL